ncbi:MAG: hypothetical protein AABX70_08395 [Nanoarchaeota archaeon]
MDLRSRFTLNNPFIKESYPKQYPAPEVRRMNPDLLLENEDEKWYSPEELDLELGGELMEDAARELRERHSFIEEGNDEATDAS